MEATFLTEDQIFGDNALDVIKAYGTGVGFSDLAVLQGGLMSGGNTNIEGKRTGAVWSASPVGMSASCASAFEATRSGLILIGVTSPRALLCHHR